MFQHVQNDSKISDRKRQEINFSLLSKSQEITSLLIEHGANINILDNDGNTVLHETRDRKLILLAIKEGINVNAKNKNGSIPLHSNHPIEVVKLLIKQGANVNEKNNQGKTPG